ncbi:AraC family transcriptional regulator [Chryseobacterium wangxinyae]|uniref:helix-turn-helix domain-containing protein n=1 Tax=Chryseobacterium sp. CY350 TaxID=2997336 RepID=UPI00226F8530|nr:AraC family transcriptional regulator [Chryseobacterium sp. CY350]MCY0976661.1 AraC family transcriptional regulator [Chryseobacterium sp. CY350]WBZ96662.1 AraC family transcriptional regulator [Chryseobacterium sp. CY350]
MQNDNLKCGMTEIQKGIFTDDALPAPYVWYEKDWQHDEYMHSHEHYQMTYVAEGYQYFHIEQKIYLVPKNHVIWIPKNKEHRTTSEADTVDLMVVLFRSVPTQDFYRDVHVFSAPAVLREMLLYASKWNKHRERNPEKLTFLRAILVSLPNFCDENDRLQIPVPKNVRLIKICNYINQNCKYGFDIDEMAAKAQMSVRTLQRSFKKETGITIQKYLQLVRILKSVEFLDAQKYTLSEIAFKVGYKSLPAFTSSFYSVMKTKIKQRI